MIHEIYSKATIDLNGVWKYKIDQNDVGKRQSYYLPTTKYENWRDVNVPHNWYLEEEIGDFFGTIWYQREFTIPKEMAGQRLFVNFEGVDYISEVWVNGVYLGKHEGMFDPFEYEITDHVKLDGTNVLVVRDNADKDPSEYIRADFQYLADSEANPLSESYKFHQSKGITQIKGHMIEAMHKPGSMTKYRQDGNSGGLWGDVKLVAKPDVYIDYIRSYTQIGWKKDWLGDKQDKTDGTGLAAFDIYINSSRKHAYKTKIVLDVAAFNFDDARVHTIKREVVIQPGDNIFKMTITIPDVQLWWTWDLGKPNMYTATVKIDVDEASLNIGVKDIVTDEDGQWYLNGTKLFLRGMRYISSLWMSEANEQMWRKDFDLMLDMDINAIRIGSHVEKRGLYALCDELGLLMWQVFPLHYTIDESDDVIDRASDMMINMGQMLVNHASMGMWSVFKEPEIYGLPDLPNNYFRLCEVLKETLGTIDTIRWIHLGDYREGVQNIMIGSCQDGDMNIKTAEIKPNIVEFGADSIPNLNSLKKFIPEDKLWPPDWDVWEYWGLFYRNQFKRAKVEIGNSIEEFIHNTQAYEALVVKEQIEVLRQRKYQPVASMFLYYWSDACPIMGSGLFDYWREPYLVYEAMKKVYSRVLISLEWNRDPYVIGREKKYDRTEVFEGKIHVNNDFHKEIENAVISWEIKRKDNGEVRVSKRFIKTLASDSVAVLDTIKWIIPEDYIGLYTVEMNVTDQEGKVLSENSMEFKACN